MDKKCCHLFCAFDAHTPNCRFSFVCVWEGDSQKSKEYNASYQSAIDANKFIHISRTEGISTTDVIDRIINRIQIDENGEKNFQ